MAEWQEGQLFRMISHWILVVKFSAGQPVALGDYNLELGQFKVTHEFDFEQPKVGEQLNLSRRYMLDNKQKIQTIAIRITGTTHDPEQEDEVIYTFRQDGEWQYH